MTVPPESDVPAAPRLRVFGREMPLPRSFIARTILGVALVLFGLLGFLPVLGFWMVPLGLFVLAQDFPFVRRFNRRAGVWIRRKWHAWRGRGAGASSQPGE